MRFEVFKYMLEIEKAGSVNKASERFFISQQGLNQVISSAENELGFKLLERTPRGVRPTKAGSIFLKHAKDIVAEYESMIDEVNKHLEIAQEKDLRLSLVATPYAINSVISPIAAETNLFDQVAVRETTLEYAFEDMAHAPDDTLFLVDLFQANPKHARIGSDYDFVELFHTVIGASWHESFPIERREWISKDNLSVLPVVMFDDPTARYMYSHVFRDNPLQNVVMSTTNPKVLRDWQSAGRGLVLSDSFSTYLSSKGLEGLRFAKIEGGYRSKIGFMQKTGREPSPEAQRWRDLFAHHFRRINDSYYKSLQGIEL